MKKTFAEILKDDNEAFIRKVSAKIPSWEGLEIPTKLNFEQASSQKCASLKAKIVCDRFGAGLRIADLTGGLGVDTAAFASGIASRVLYNERDRKLYEAAVRNFTELGLDNIDFSLRDIDGKPDFLYDFHPDLIYLDPARRDCAGKKVFLLEDCSPNIVSLSAGLLEIAPAFLCKLSPMADISMVFNRLPQVNEIFIIELDGECKELLCLARRDVTDSTTLGRGTRKVILLDASMSDSDRSDSAVQETALEFDPENLPLPAFAGKLSAESLYVPSAGLMKSGCHGALTAEYGIELISSDTRYFIGNRGLAVPFTSEYKILDILPLSRADALKTVLMSFPDGTQGAEFSARGIHMTSEQLRRRCRITKGSNSIHVFGVRHGSGNFLIICKK